ncbi:MAG: multidrug efflux SMR transporter [Actinomycetota bacterium]
MDHPIRTDEGRTVPEGTTGAGDNPMAWMILALAGAFEVAWASLLGETKGFTRLLPSVGFVVTLAISMYLLSMATRTIPVGTGYAVWVGIGAVGAFAVSVLLKGQETNVAQILAIMALVGSIVAVKLTAA